MNIFILSEDYQKNVEFYCDSHVSKMTLETAQLLCMAHYLSTSPDNPNPPYKYCKTHRKHPCCLWAAKSLSNYNWLVSLGEHIAREFKYRRGKEHASYKVINWAKTNTPNIVDIGLTPFVQCMGEQYKCENVVRAYRQYYNAKKQHIAKWTKRPTPFWFIRNGS